MGGKANATARSQFIRGANKAALHYSIQLINRHGRQEHHVTAASFMTNGFALELTELNFEYNDRRKKIIPNNVQTKYARSNIALVSCTSN